MREQLENYIATAQYLGDEKSESILKKLKERLEQKRLFVPIIGQFNAGKSRLINNLLGKDLLPVKGVETTAFITFIEYGEDECFVEDRLGKLIPITFETLKNIHQVSIDKAEGLGNVSIEEIRAIHVKVKNDFLAGGLVLVDTPGVNTLVKAHEELAYSILPEAQYLIYVFGKAVSKTDLDIIKKVKKLGVRIIFVRTKLDAMKSNEETVEDIIEDDVVNIETEFGTEYLYFPLTNEKDLFTDAFWKECFNKFYSYLQVNVSSNVAEAIEKSLYQRLESLREEFLKQLEEKLENIKKLASDDEEELKKKLEAVDSQIAYLERESRIVSQKVRNSIDEINNSLKLDILRTARNNVDYYKQALEEVKDINKLQVSAIDKAQLSLEKMVEESEECVEKQINNLMESSFELYREKLLTVKNMLTENIDLSFNVELENINIESFNESKNYHNEKLREEIEAITTFLNKSEKELEEYDLKKEDMEELSKQLELYVEGAKQEVMELGNYVPKELLIEGNTNVSEALGRIGNLADWALLFLPSTALSKGGVKIAATLNKVVEGSKQGKKVADAIGKAGKAIQKTAKTMSNLDKAKDTVYVLKQVKDKVKKTGLDEKIGILDLLTLEFWFKKAGSVFDTPPRIEIDRAYEAEFHNEKEKLNHRYREYVVKELKQLEEMDLIKSNEARLKKEMELKEKYIQKANKQLEEQKESIHRQAELKAREEYIKECVKQYVLKSEELQKEITQGIDQVIKGVVNDLIAYSTAEAQSKLTKLKSEIEELITLKQTSSEKVEELMRSTESYMEGLSLWIL
jgi:GTPase Era involved in 16S rRNA processing